MTPKDDQLCANMITRIIKVSDDYIKSQNKSLAASVIPTDINKARVIAEFISSGKLSSSYVHEGRAASAPILAARNKVLEIANFIKTGRL